MEFLKGSIVNLGNTFVTHLSNLGDFIADSLLDLCCDLLDGLSSLGDLLVDSFNASCNALELAINFLGDIFNSVGTSIIDGLSSLGEFIVDGLKGVLELLFVPSSNLFDDVQDLFNSKFEVFSQVSQLVNSLTFSNDDDMPEFTITLYGVRMKFFDFSMFAQYRTFIHRLILMIAYFRFAFWLLNNAPAIVTGTGGGLSEKGVE